MDDMLTNIANTVESSNSVINDFVNKVNSYEFTADVMISKVIGTFRYIVGEYIYMTFVFIISISMAFMIYKLIIKLFNIVIALFPTFGKIQ